MMLDWFTTIPGILIICGVLLLIIAIALFVVGSMKNKKKESSSDASLNAGVNEIQNDNVSNLNVDNSVIAATLSTNLNSTSENNNVLVDGANINSINNSEISISPVMENSDNLGDNSISVSENSEIDTVTSFEFDEPQVISIPDMSDSEEVESTPIYGGVDPVYTFKEEEKPVTIYGGNDPLEATQTLPKVEQAHVPYGGVVVNNEPVINEEVVSNIPVEENVIEMPKFDEVKPIEITETVEEIVTPVIDIPIVDDSQTINSTPQTDISSIVNTSSEDEKVAVVEEL